MRLGPRELQAPTLGSSSKGFGRGRDGSNSSSEGNGQRSVDDGKSDDRSGDGDQDGDGGGGHVDMSAGDRDSPLEGMRIAGSDNGDGSGGVSSSSTASAEVVITGRDYENSDHSGEGVEDDGVSSTMSRGSLLRGENTCAIPINRAQPAVVVPTSSGKARGSGDGGGGRNSSRSGDGGDVLGGLTGGGGGRNECKLGRDEDAGGVSMGVNEVHSGSKLEDLDSSARSTDGLIGSSFLNSYGDHAAGGDGVEVSERCGRVKGRARGPGGPRHPRIRPTHERGASPASTPRNLPRAASGDDSGGLGGAEFLSSPGGTRLLDAYRSPLSESTATGSVMTEAGARWDVDDLVMWGGKVSSLVLVLRRTLVGS